MGFGDVPGTIKRTVLALDRAAMEYHIQKTFEAEDLIALNNTDWTPNVIRQYGEIWNCDEDLCGQIWSDADFGTKPINPYNYGPWVTGFMNAYDSKDDKDGLIVLNQSVKSDDPVHTVEYFNRMIDFFYTKGYLGGAIVSFAIAMNPEGYQSSFVFDTPIAYNMYKEALDDFDYTNPVLYDKERDNTDVIFEQWIGLKDDL